MKKFDVILADPPWKYKNISTRAAAVKHYPVMSLKDIIWLPVEELAADRCALFLWATWPTMPNPFDVITGWGFQYKTLAWDWFKTNLAEDKFIIGLGNYSRANPEPCLLAFKNGKPIKVADHSVPAFIFSPRQAHSQKPDKQYEYIERLYPDANKIELFARKVRPGWAAWGNRIESTIKFDRRNKNWSEA